MKLFNNLWASLMMFTRLPLWRIHEVPSECFRHSVDWWPIAGWLTGGTMAGVYFIAAMHYPPSVAMLLAIASRVILTGALHEDGLADFCDGMFGGTNRQRILEIMKDSHIGTYGVLGLILYFLILYNVGSSISTDPLHTAIFIFTADVWCKSVSSLIVDQLPYARKESEAKNRTIYTPMHLGAHALRIILAMVPVVALLALLLVPLPPVAAFVAPVFAELLLVTYMRHKIQGYTGDCCGATFLLTELTFYLFI